LANRGSSTLKAKAGEARAMRRARRLAVEFDVGSCCFALRRVRSREAALAYIIVGTTGAMVGM